ncbi:Histone deacetylase hda1, partial [Haplosporangium sp. Z 27]
MKHLYKADVDMAPASPDPTDTATTTATTTTTTTTTPSTTTTTTTTATLPSLSTLSSTTPLTGAPITTTTTKALSTILLNCDPTTTNNNNNKVDNNVNNNNIIAEPQVSEPIALIRVRGLEEEQQQEKVDVNGVTQAQSGTTTITTTISSSPSMQMHQDSDQQDHDNNNYINNNNNNTPTLHLDPDQPKFITQGSIENEIPTEPMETTADNNNSNEQDYSNSNNINLVESVQSEQGDNNNSDNNDMDDDNNDTSTEHRQFNWSDHEIEYQGPLLPQPDSLNGRSTKTGYVYDVRMKHHNNVHGDDDHPEDPRRIWRIFHALVEAQIPKRMIKIPSREATMEELHLVHTKDHVEKITKTAGLNKDELLKMANSYNSIYLNNSSAFCARLSCGSLIELCKAVATGQVLNGLAIIRPPGHHAEPHEAGGFCLYNNVAIAARYLQNAHGLRKIFILD